LNGKQEPITDENLTIARTNGLQTALNGKQVTITNGSLTIARKSGLQDALDETAKLASANVFTSNQEITGNFKKANIVQVAITTPTLNANLTSKLYEDTSIAQSTQTLQTQSTSQSEDIIAIEQLTSTNTSDTFALQVGNQNTLEAGTGIDLQIMLFLQLHLLLLLGFVLLRVKIQI
jgi:hypothetical protein